MLHTDSAVFGGGQSGSISPLVPKEVMLFQIWPNPTSGRMTIRFGVPRPMKLSLKVYDISGKLVRTLVNNQATKPGYCNLGWNATDDRNRRVASGIYFYRLAAELNRQDAKNAKDQIRTKKLIIARQIYFPPG